ncbi:hypothetical protein CALVIDRAFT_502730 [Calocera viscosa TUFC12733]|uniref:RTA1 domain protein n=1 Tax=Calocera viscosa (strain TUFC12733) TaxID=1330018 RepID=A0A167JKG0_CALVF|nr:hypothetical protein CALVIDRAFT_502730 [Calocera viscosa TUFC12733]
MSSNSTLPAGFAEGSWWYYAPNKVAPIIFAILFLASGIWHLYQTIRYKTWKSTTLFPVACLIFVAGYIVREIAAYHYDSIGFYMATSIILLCSPPFYEAANCFVLARIMYYIPYEAPLHPWRLMLTFGVFQSILDSVTNNGASKATTPFGGQANQLAGRILLNVSFSMQIFSMLCFIAIALRFEYNCRRSGVFPETIRNALRVVYVSCALISVRTIYRAVEWFGTNEVNPSDPSTFPPVLRQEAYFYVFEASVMLSNSLLLNIFPPTRFLPRDFKIFLAPDGVTEMEGKGMLKKDPRKLWQQFCDPFDLYGLFTKRDQKLNLWEQERQVDGTPSSDASSDMEKFGWGNWGNDDDLVKVV